ncbi:MAG: hemerythrin domain-containing protein [Bacteroidia bacterium]
MIQAATTLQAISSHHPLFETVLERYSLRYSDPGSESGEGLPVGVACKQASINSDFLIEILRVFEFPQSFDAEKLKLFPIPVILDYLYRTHQYYQNKRLAEIELSVDRIAEVYGQQHPLLVLLRSFFQRYKNQLAGHIAAEEKALFPHAQNVYEARLNGNAVNDDFDYEQFLHGHGEDELDLPLREIQRLVERRHPEVKTLFPYNVLNWQLNALQQDLWIHERVEEDVLIEMLR